MQKNLNFEGFWKCVQINFFGSRVDVHTKPHLISAPLISHINTRLVVRVEEQADDLKDHLLAALEAVKVWLIEESVSVSIPYNWEGHLGFSLGEDLSQTVPLCGRCGHVCVLQHSRSRGSQREAVDSVACHNWYTSQGTPNPLNHIYYMLGDGGRPFWR